MPDNHTKRNPMEVLRGPFDPDVHAETFINYLEVIVTDQGTVLYATPSHFERLIALYCKQNGLDYLNPDERREYVYQQMPDDAAPVDWLCEKTGSIAVWYDHYEGKPSPNTADALHELRHRGIYNGPVPMPLMVDYIAYPDDEPVTAVHCIVPDIKPLLDTYDLDTINNAGNDVNELPGFIDDLDLYLFLPISRLTWTGDIRCRLSYLSCARYRQMRAQRSKSEDDEAIKTAKGLLVHDAYLRLLDQESMLNLRKHTLSELSQTSKL